MRAIAFVYIQENLGNFHFVHGRARTSLSFSARQSLRQHFPTPPVCQPVSASTQYPNGGRSLAYMCTETNKKNCAGDIMWHNRRSSYFFLLCTVSLSRSFLYSLNVGGANTISTSAASTQWKWPRHAPRNYKRPRHRRTRRDGHLERCCTKERLLKWRSHGGSLLLKVRSSSFANV